MVGWIITNIDYSMKLLKTASVKSKFLNSGQESTFAIAGRKIYRMLETIGNVALTSSIHLDCHGMISE